MAKTEKGHGKGNSSQKIWRFPPLGDEVSSLKLLLKMESIDCHFRTSSISVELCKSV